MNHLGSSPSHRIPKLDFLRLSRHVSFFLLSSFFVVHIQASTVFPATPTPDLLVEAAELATLPALTKMERDSDMTPKKISETAEDVLAMAREFLENASPSVLTVLDEHSDKKCAEDRLIKIGRNVFGSVLRYGKDGTNEDPARLEAAMTLLVEESNQLSSILEGRTTTKVPKVRFGKTELQMPIVTLGCMRFQQSWNRGDATSVVDISQVQDDCQENLVNILRYAHKCGVTHIETAQRYGSSQLQLGFALKQLFDSGEIKREDLIIQTKIPVGGNNSVADYRDSILACMRELQLDYLDLVAVHGLNTQSDYDALFNNPKGNLCEALTELKEKGIIRYGIGFSTHAPAKLIQKAIETDFFDYINLHYQWCGSYTASGDLDAGNLANVRLANKKDMGVFIISVYDKGGRLYTPSNKLRDLCLPDMEPMTYGSVWLWQHGKFDAEHAAAHTFTVGAARPSDLDQPIVHALALAEQGKDLAERRERTSGRLNQAMVDALGQEWVDTWNQGLLNAHDSKYQTHHTGLVWCHNMIKAWGMLDFCKDRYGPMEGFLKKWSVDKTKEENMKNLLGGGFAWMPGVAVDPSLDYTPDFANCPEGNKERLLEAIHFVHEWASKPAEGQEPKKVPLEWEAAFDMRPWTAFPER